MPTYEYRCKSCDHEFEIVQAFSDDALTECPECQGQLKKVFGNVGIAFKGSGFYKTDSRSGGSTGSTDSNSGGSDSKGSGGSGSSSESATSAPKSGGESSSTSATPTTTASS